MSKKPVKNKTFQTATLAELKREATRQMGMKKLKCPECGAPVIFTHIDEATNTETVMFKCLFAGTFDRGISPEEAQRRLEEYKAGNWRRVLKGGCSQNAWEDGRMA